MRHRGQLWRLLTIADLIQSLASRSAVSANELPSSAMTSISPCWPRASLA
jgi:hypothetical protein